LAFAQRLTYFNDMSFNRRQFVRLVPTLGAFAWPTIAAGAAQQAPEPVWPAPPPGPGVPVDDSFPSQHPALAKEIVGVSHFGLARVKELVQLHPSLAKASWDWGYGDWETALGAASHTGQRAIAELLIENGAPHSLYSATMLGQLDVVKTIIATSPGAQRLRGPHSLSLMVHARNGGPRAAAVVLFLESLGDADLPLPNEALAPEERASLEGRYVFGDRPRDRFVVDVQQNQLGLNRPGGTRRNLFHLGRLEFHPNGAPAARIRFERTGTKIAALTVSDPDLIVRARRED
jgi:hypothetical protein